MLHRMELRLFHISVEEKRVWVSTNNRRYIWKKTFLQLNVIVDPRLCASLFFGQLST